MEKQELEALLKRNRIPYRCWGTGQAKTVDHLLKEVNAGEAVMETRNGVLTRIIKVSAVIVRYKNDGVEFVLTEDKQVFADGREIKRNHEASISEKILDETPVAAAHRALAEELGIKKHQRVDLLKIETDTKPTPQYPGLPVHRTVVFFRATLSGEAYKPEGYIERRPEKTSYFIWKPVAIPAPA